MSKYICGLFYFRWYFLLYFLLQGCVTQREYFIHCKAETTDICLQESKKLCDSSYVSSYSLTQEHPDIYDTSIFCRQDDWGIFIFGF